MKRIFAATLLLLSLSPPVLATDIEAGFSPNGGAADLVLRTIGEARHEILVAAYTFTAKPIAHALVEAARSGVHVRVILDKSQRTERYSSATYLANAGIPVRIDSAHSGIFHDKYLIVDSRTLETGSFNYTSSATSRNAENAIVIRDDRELALKYTHDWEQHWNHSQPYAARY